MTATVLTCTRNATLGQVVTGAEVEYQIACAAGIGPTVSLSILAVTGAVNFYFATAGQAATNGYIIPAGLALNLQVHDGDIFYLYAGAPGVAGFQVLGQ